MNATLVGTAELVEIEETSVWVDGVVQVGAVFIWDSMVAPPFTMELRLEFGFGAEMGAESDATEEVAGVSCKDDVCA